MLDPGLGTLLRAVIARLDGDVQLLYDELNATFRPRFFPVVQDLSVHGSRTVSQLAESAGVSQPAITQTLSEMGKLKLVEITRGSDARERRVALSKAGKRTAEQLQPLWSATRQAAVDLDRELPYSLTAVLQATIEALDRQPFRNRIRSKLDE